MLFRKGDEDMIELKPVSAITLMPTEQEVNDEYRRLSEEAGGVHELPQNDSLFAYLLTKMQEHEILVYPTDQVIEYMREERIMRDQSLSWWQRRMQSIRHEWRMDYATAADCPYSCRNYCFHRYQGEIPLHAVRKMAVLRGDPRLKDSLKFYVYHLGVRIIGDPFLKLEFRGKVEMIIDHWDEPGFKLVR